MFVHLRLHLGDTRHGPTRPRPDAPRDTLWGLRPRGATDVGVRFASADRSHETVISLEAHMALAALLPMRPDLRSDGALPVDDDRPRLKAAEWLAAHWLRAPIPKERRPFTEAALRMRARATGETPKCVLRELTVQNIFVAISDVRRVDDLEALLADLRRRVANAICEDLLGPGWRRREVGSETPLRDPDGLASPTNDFAEVDRRDARARIVKQPGLTRREAEVFRLMESGRTTADIAEALDIAQSTVRVHRKNLVDKLAPLYEAI